MNIPLDAIKELRNLTSASVAECKKALGEANGNVHEAMALLRKRGLEIAAKKGERNAREGRIEAYVHHGNKLGVLLEVNCETDFVAKNHDFAQFTKDIALHITASNPEYIKRKMFPPRPWLMLEIKRHITKNTVCWNSPSSKTRPLP